MSPFKKFRRKIKQSFWQTVFSITDFSASRNVSIDKKTLLIIKNDLIGDYILFRNFLPYIKQSKKYQDHKIILIGNIAWKNIAETLDAEYYDEMIWVSFDKLYKNLGYRAKTVKSILSRGYETLFYPVYSGDIYTEEFLIAKIKANEKIKYAQPLPEIGTTVHPCFTEVIRSTHRYLFEIYRYKEMFELFLDISIDSFQWRDLTIVDHASIPEKPYVVFFPGSSAYLKRWDTSNFITVANYLLAQYPYQIVLTGSKKDSKYASAIITGVDAKYTNRFTDLTGKTSLLDLANVICNSELLVTNDSASLHMAAAANKETVCVFMGESYGRFTPYPPELFIKGKFICPPEVVALVEQQKTTPVFLLLGYNPDINKVAPTAVIAAIEELVGKQHKKYSDQPIPATHN
ncbi:MAG TPA: glycosyltransferase family 9 protein [Ferruginibacter sp.]|nr:glycosyltransferase family 9 protein [Ferruginibacter sp.]